MKDKRLKNKFVLVFIFIFSIALFFFGRQGFVAFAEENNKEYDDLEPSINYTEYILSKGVVIPEGFSENADVESFVDMIVQEVKKNPNVVFLFNYEKTLDFANSIKRAILRDENTVYDNVFFEETEYILQDSLVQAENGNWVSSGGAWQNEWENYNCYAYAIGLTEDLPSDLTVSYPIGYFANTGNFYYGIDMLDLAEIVVDDLEYLGYNPILSETEPSNIGLNERVLCVRKSSWDYHFMIKGEDDSWYHKPGITAPLKYKYSSPEQTIWKEEGSYRGEIVYGEERYDSDIYYIRFSPPIFETDEMENNTCAITGIKEWVDLIGAIEVPQTIAGKTVTAIGNYVFGGQAGITSVEIPTTVTSIGSFAFSGCSNLTEVTGLNSVETIGVSTFNGCSALEEIELPASLIAIGFNAFTYCNEMNVTVAPNNPNFTAVGNVVYNKSMTKLLFAGKTSSTVAIPATVTEVDYDAFKGNPDVSIVMFEGSPLIRSGAFTDCEGLFLLHFFGMTLPTIEAGAFDAGLDAAFVPYDLTAQYTALLAPYTSYIMHNFADISFYNEEILLEIRSVRYGETITYLPEPQEMVGVVFSGWYDNPEFTGEPYEVGDVWMFKADASLYAKWELIVPPNNAGGEGAQMMGEPIALVPKREEITV